MSEIQFGCVDRALNNPERFTCGDTHEGDLSDLTRNVHSGRALAQVLIGVELQPADFIITGPAIALAEAREPFHAVDVRVERWAMDKKAQKLALLASEARWIPTDREYRLLNRQLEARGSGGSFSEVRERARLRRIAEAIIVGGNLVVHTLDLTAYTEVPEQRLMQRVRAEVQRPIGTVPPTEQMIGGRTTRLYHTPTCKKPGQTATASQLAATVLESNEDARLRLDLAHITEGQLLRAGSRGPYYVTQLLTETELRPDIGYSAYGMRRALLPDRDRMLVQQHAVHTRLRELSIVTDSLYSASDIVGENNRLRTGRELRKAARVALSLF